MSPVGSQWRSVVEAIDPESPLGRILVYGEQRYWLLTALERLGGPGTVEAPGPSAEAWSSLCQYWRLKVEGTARTAGAMDPSVVDGGLYVSTVLAAHATALSRLERPAQRFAELWCTGQPRRVEIGKIVAHQERCLCVLFSLTLNELEKASGGEELWQPWGVEQKVWIGHRGLAGPHVVRLIHGVPSSLEEHAGFGHTDAVFDWGVRTSGSSELARAILNDAVGEMPDIEVSESFVSDVVMSWPEGRPFMLACSEVHDWYNEALRAGSWIAGWPDRLRGIASVWRHHGDNTDAALD